ncbi:MAG TPA: hypothetical protein VGL62_00255 [Vicinamibacterales bacterium]
MTESQLRHALGNAVPDATASPFWDDAAREFRSFLCTNSAAYADLRSRWTSLRGDSIAAAAAALSAAIGTRLGAPSSVIAPLVAALLMSAVRLGRLAICDHLERSDVVSALQ